MLIAPYPPKNRSDQATGYSCEQVNFTRNGKTLLHHINFTAPAGQITAIIGPNGAGKSTLFKILSGEHLPCSGDVTFAGCPIHTLSRADMAQQRAVVAQSSTFDLNFNVADVVAMGRYPHRHHDTPAACQSIVQKACARMGITHLLSHKYPTLSGGEKQRVHCARALAQIWDRHTDHNPAFILLDEPTASLDIAYQLRVLHTLRTLAASGVGVIIILHDLSQVLNYTDQCLLLQDGKVAAFGKTQHVVTEQTIAQVFQCNAQRSYSKTTGWNIHWHLASA
jgi:iron complex transport system ATP-binding protein